MHSKHVKAKLAKPNPSYAPPSSTARDMSAIRYINSRVEELLAIIFRLKAENEQLKMDLEATRYNLSERIKELQEAELEIEGLHQSQTMRELDVGDECFVIMYNDDLVEVPVRRTVTGKNQNYYSVGYIGDRMLNIPRAGLGKVIFAYESVKDMGGLTDET